jgi:glucose/arabinose dehydrogenase
MKTILKSILVSVCMGFCSMAANLPSGFVETRLATNLNPTNISMAPDGRIFICEKNGVIKIVKNGTLLGTAFLTISGVDTFNERGLETIEFDPDFSIQAYVYVYYTTTVGGTAHNRVSRFTANGDVSDPTTELVLLDLDNLGAGIHNGGELLFLSDKTLLITAGENGNASNAQSFSSMLGKVHRINRDGSIPVNNPYFTTLTGKFRSIYALGFRNPFKGYIQPGTGKIYINDVGNASWEEINELQSGKNYGWPTIEGKITTETAPANYVDPVFVYDHTQGCCVTGGSFCNASTTAFPTTFIGKYFYADYCNGYIRMIDPTNPVSFTGFATNINRCIDMVIDNTTGSLYYLARGGLGGGSTTDNTSSNNGELWKVDFNGSTNVSISVQPEGVEVSEHADAFLTTSSNGSQPISYQWQKNNINIQGATTLGLNLTNISILDNGAQFKAIIHNNTSTITSNIAVLTVIANLLPNVTITSPLPGAVYKGGDVITFSGIAEDPEDGVLGASQFTWSIDFHHDSHIHPALDPVSGIKNGTYTVPTIGEVSSNVWLRIYLTAKDLDNAPKTIYTEVFPVKSNITLKTNPLGMYVKLDGSPVVTPYSFTGVAGIERTLEAVSPQSFLLRQYTFAGWSNNGSKIQTISTPALDSTFIASFAIIISVPGTNPTDTTTTNISDEKSSIKVFPNPTIGKIYVTGFKSGLFTISDILDKILKAGILEEEIDIATLPAGSYILRIISDSGLLYRRLIIKQ